MTKYKLEVNLADKKAMHYSELKEGEYGIVVSNILTGTVIGRVYRFPDQEPLFFSLANPLHTWSNDCSANIQVQLLPPGSQITLTVC